MIGEQQIKEILAQYKKHGWNLRRVLLSADASENLSAVFLREQANIVSSEINAAWFSRRSGDGRETWELRRLSGTPFALVEVFEEAEAEAAREKRRREVETRLKEQASKFGNKNVTN